MKSPSPSRVLAELSAQHTMLRGMMDRCEELADELDAGRMGPLQLQREVERLRLAFEAHNRFEEQLLRPILIDAHISEHRAMRNKLASPATADLRAVIGDMRAHLAAEERSFNMVHPLRRVGA